METQFEEGDIVLCTVDRIIGTNVFVKIEGNGEGTIIFSEIAPGRIRNIRNYVVPKKKIVCKVLRISPKHIDLSLRRVTKKEKKEKLEEIKQEKSYMNILKSVLKDKAEKIIEEIQKEDNIYDFFEEAKENPKNLEKLVGKKDSQKILDILKTQKQKRVIIKKGIFLTTKKPDGLSLIKDILKDLKEIKVKYISAGHYTFETESEDAKTADNKLRDTLSEIEKEAKRQGVEFSIKEKWYEIKKKKER